MQNDFDFILENVRVFDSRQVFPIRRLTLLVGENSAGKTTMLGMLNAFAGPGRSLTTLETDRAPFTIGGFDSIVTRSSTTGPQQFTVGVVGSSIAASPQLSATYTARQGGVALSALELRWDQGSLTIPVAAEGKAAATLVVNGKQSTRGLAPSLPLTLRWDRFHVFLAFLFDEWSSEKRDGGSVTRRVRVGQLPQGLPEGINQILHWLALPVIPIAPIRSRPRRTYDIVRTAYDPEGEHVPGLIKNVNEGVDNGRAGNVLETLERFAAESNLYDHVGVRKLGKKPGDPFQLLVGRGKHAVNLIDVGYGVSQALPLVVQIASAPRDSIVLVQQPEVHLHPRAQAGLGSFFVNCLAERPQSQLVIETHSDYIVDRVRQEIANGRIASEDVSLLFFDKQKRSTTVHRIKLDDMGNVVDPPASYRAFFLEEYSRLVGRGS